MIEMKYVIKEIKETGAGVSIEIHIPDLGETLFLNMDALSFYRKTEEELDRELERVVENREQVYKMKNDPDSKIQGMINSGESLKDRLNKRSEEKHKEGAV